MKYKPQKSYFKLNSQERKGIFLLLILMTFFEIGCYFLDFSKPIVDSKAAKEWLSQQIQIENQPFENQVYKYKIYPFNPNFLTDSKAYKLGLTVAQFDKLLAFRKTNQFANSAAAFQAVTGISDSLSNAISPYFKFPVWVKNQKQTTAIEKTPFVKKEAVEILDINQATPEDLIKIYGIGPAISERILKEKDKFGAFASMQQMNDIWGLSPEVIEKLNQHFKVLNHNNLKKIKINEASIKELMQFPYFKYAVAKEIVIYRSSNGEIKIEDLSKINDFPVDKINIIALYLDF